MVQRFSLLIFLLSAAIAGCNKGPSIATSPVKGTVTYGGKPVAGATVTFVSKKTDAHPSSGVTDPDGHFSLSTYVGPAEILRGAVPGDYQVTIIKQAVTGEAQASDAQNLESMTPEERQAAMANMWTKQKASSPDGNRPPPPPKPKSEIPVKYAKPESSGLAATVVVGENDPFDFKLSDD